MKSDKTAQSDSVYRQAINLHTNRAFERNRALELISSALLSSILGTRWSLHLLIMLNIMIKCCIFKNLFNVHYLLLSLVPVLDATDLCPRLCLGVAWARNESWIHVRKACELVSSQVIDNSQVRRSQGDFGVREGWIEILCRPSVPWRERLLIHHLGIRKQVIMGLPQTGDERRLDIPALYLVPVDPPEKRMAFNLSLFVRGILASQSPSRVLNHESLAYFFGLFGQRFWIWDRMFGNWGK